MEINDEIFSYNIARHLVCYLGFYDSEDMDTLMKNRKE